MAITLCFSKFWRMRRAEKVRKERKQEEEEEDFMRMMGIDPNGPLYSDSESSDTEDDDESDEEAEQETQPLNQQVYAAPQTQNLIKHKVIAIANILIIVKMYDAAGKVPLLVVNKLMKGEACCG
jgi:hypothetical protein